MRTRVHMNLAVADLDAAVRFYEAMFGVEASKRKEDYANFRLETPSLHLALVHQPCHKGKAIQNGEDQHFGVELFDESDLAAWLERVKAAGLMPYLEEENVTCCYAVADKFWLHDPDGNEWEFWVRQNDADAMHGEAERSSCCAPASVPAQTSSCCP